MATLDYNHHEKDGTYIDLSDLRISTFCPEEGAAEG